jgi:cytochrome c-type biogenesis protein CcmH/NrfG
VSWVGPVAALLTGVALLGALAPFMRRGRPQQGPPSSLQDRRLRLLRVVRDLERDHVRGAVADGDYKRLRDQAEAEVVALIRGASSADQTARQRSPRREQRRRGRRVPGQPALVAAIASAAVAAAAVPMLLGSVGGRPAGGFITGTQPASAPPGSAIALEQHVSQYPNDLEARLDLAQTYLEAGQPRQASQQYVEVLKRDPNNPEATTRLALLVYEAGDTNDALSGVEKVLAQHPDYPEALFIDGVILLNGENRPKDAIAPLQRYLQVAPTGGYRDDAQQLLQQAQGQTG